MHEHEPGHGTSPSVRRKLVVATTATALFVAFELGAGLFANSLGLVGDALHNLTDGAALALALLAAVLERRRPTIEKSFGYQRAGILAAFVNAATLLILAAFFFIETWERLRRPQSVDETVMLWVAVLAFVFNAATAAWLHKDGRHDLNVRTVVLHQIGDALGSLGVIAAAVLIRVTGSTLFDPLVSVLIGILILWSSWSILRETVNLLLEGTPRGIDPDEVSRSLAAIEGVFGVHHLHIWALGPSHPALSCHLLLGDVTLHGTELVLEEVNALLAERYGIVHTTVQFEHAACAKEEAGCDSPSPPPHPEGCNT